MTFAARGILVSLAFFAVVYSLVSSLVVLVWQGIRRMGWKPSSNSANLLFGLRISPFIVSLGVSVFFAFPSFWVLERRSLDEDTGTFVLGFCSLVILGAGLVRVMLAEARTKRAVTQWQLSSSNSESGAIPSAIKASQGAPPLILVGIWTPNIMVSDMAATLLNDEELRAAGRH